jgi:hypothetical protein
MLVFIFWHHITFHFITPPISHISKMESLPKVVLVPYTVVMGARVRGGGGRVGPVLARVGPHLTNGDYI